jgi:3'-5' exoribonuclease
MKSIFICDLRPNQDATSVFLVQSKDIRQKKSGEPYLSLSLMDRTGEMEAKMWDNVAEVMNTFERDDFVKVKGRMQVYQNRIQFAIHKMQRIDDALVELQDFFPASQRNTDEMFLELRQMVAGMKNSHLRALMEALLDDSQIADGYRRAPAAKTIHHAYLGGLLEHVLAVCQLCRFVAGQYSFLDADLMLAGAITHDLGKIQELSYRRSFGYTDDGQLLGHVVLGLRLVDDKLRALPDFPPRLRSLLEHMMLSHHGELEYGAAKVPVFGEALMLHYLDNLDSKMQAVRNAIEKDHHVDGCWTGLCRGLERSLLKKEKYLSEAVAQSSPGSESPSEAPSTAALVTSAPESREPAARPQSLSLFGERLKDALKKVP